MVRLPTNLVAGQAGHVAHSNQAYELLNQLQHPAGVSGSRIINVQDPPEDVSNVAATGDRVTDDNVAIQNILDWVGDTPSDGNQHVVWFPFRNAAGNSARYMTSKPLRVWTQTHILGPAIIKAHPNFDWVNHPYWEHPGYRPVGNPQPGDIALMELWDLPGTGGRGSYARIYLEDITLDGARQPGSLGLFTKLQQPAWTWKLRIDDCMKAGWALFGNQSDNFMVEIIGCPVGLYLGPDIGGLGSFGAAGTTCKAMSFYSLNVEVYTDAAIRMNCEGPNFIQNFHMEILAGSTDCNVIDAQSGIFTLRNVRGNHAGDTNHVFVIGNKTPTPGVFVSQYTIEDVLLGNTNTTGQLMLDDKVRGRTRLVDLNRKVDVLRTLFQNDTQHDYDAAIEYLGDEQGFVRIGGLKGGNAAPPGHSGAQFTVRANTAQDERSVRFLGSDGTLRSGIHQTGNMVLGSYTNASRPVATAVEAGTMIWNTDDAAINLSDGTAWRDAVGVVT